MIKLKTDSRTPTLTPEQFASMRDALYVFLGGDALAYMGRIAVNDLISSETPEHNHDDLYAPIEHNHPQYLEGINWVDIANKPNTYPPEAHEHPEYEGGTEDARVKMWVGTGATSDDPHPVFDIELNKSAFMILRFPFSTYRFTVWGPKPNDITSCYYYDTSIGQGSNSLSDRLSSSGLAVFGAWDSLNSVYVCFNLPTS